MKLSRKDLEQLANSQAELLRTTPKNNEAYTDVIQFAMNLKLKVGKHKVKSAMVYRSYKAWSEEPLDKAEFLKQFDEIFFPEADYYLLNLRPLELLNKATL